MKTRVITKDGEVCTVVVHRAKYSLGDEERVRTIDVASNLPGTVTDEEIEFHPTTEELQQIAIDVREAIRVMNDDFVEVIDKLNLFTLHDIGLIDQ